MIQSPPMKGLMICNRIRLPYRVMRCMAMAGVEVHVLGNALSRGLRFSRSCKSFALASSQFDGSFSTAMADEVNSVARRLEVDLIFPGCALAARSFHGIKGDLEAPCFPGPSIQQFDLLNDKWEFFKVCQEEDILCPATLRLETKDELELLIREGGMKLPLIVKPLSMDGERGIFKLTEEGWEGQISKVDYSPLLLQQFVAGKDIGASVFCKKGEIVSYLAHNLSKGNYKTFWDADIYNAIQKLATRFDLEGVYNFDMRLAEDSHVYFLECNPRFFFKMPLSLAAGINFALPGLVEDATKVQASRIDETLTRTPRAWPGLFLRPWKMNNHDRALSRLLLSDPISFARELVHLDWD